jgi:hypothetical protein
MLQESKFHRGLEMGVHCFDILQEEQHPAVIQYYNFFPLLEFRYLHKATLGKFESENEHRMLYSIMKYVIIL